MNPLAKLNEPTFITNYSSADQLLLIGKYRGKGSLMSFKMSDGVINWHSEFSAVTVFNAYSKDVDTGDMYICGHF